MTAPNIVLLCACCLVLGGIVGGLTVGIIMARPSHRPGRHRGVTVHSPSGRGSLL